MKRPAHWFGKVLLTGYGLAIVWTSLAYAFDAKTPVIISSAGGAAETPVALPRASALRSLLPRTLWKTASSPRERLTQGGQKIREYIERAARTTGVRPQVAEWIVTHESRHHPDATGDGGESRGLWQINKEWHPEVSDACAYNVTCSTKWSLGRIRDGHAGEWSTWKFCQERFEDCPFKSSSDPVDFPGPAASRGASDSFGSANPFHSTPRFAAKAAAPTSFWSYAQSRPAFHGEVDAQRRALR